MQNELTYSMITFDRKLRFGIELIIKILIKFYESFKKNYLVYFR